MTETVSKDDLIELHVLLVQLREHLAPDTPTPEYDAFGVLPTHLHRSKADHKKAAFFLAHALATNLPDTPGRDAQAERLASIAHNARPPYAREQPHPEQEASS